MSEEGVGEVVGISKDLLRVVEGISNDILRVVVGISNDILRVVVGISKDILRVVVGISNDILRVVVGVFKDVLRVFVGLCRGKEGLPPPPIAVAVITGLLCPASCVLSLAGEEGEAPVMGLADGEMRAGGLDIRGVGVVM